jgi:hypothetical protein
VPELYAATSAQPDPLERLVETFAHGYRALRADELLSSEVSAEQGIM